MSISPKARLIIPALAALALLLAACGGGGATPTQEQTPLTPTAGPPSAQIRVGNTDIALGPNRILLSVLDGEGAAIGPADVRLRFFNLDGPSPEAVKGETQARFLGAETPTASALYSTRISFDGTGAWAIDAAIRRQGQATMTARTQFRVQAESLVPNIGDPAPASANLTLQEAPIAQLTSQRPPGDPDFYRLTIAAARAQRQPFMVVFSTPAFCQSRTCGPQLEAAQALKRRYGDRMNFVHIEIFQRPDLLLDGERNPQVRPTVREWRLQTEPMVFLVDAEGEIADRFEGFAAAAEVEESVVALLAS